MGIKGTENAVDTGATKLVEVWRGPILESMHFGHAAIVDASGQLVRAWGDPETIILPRSSCKMLQALPLMESGAADAAGLSDRQLALACASHNGAAIHSEAVTAWLSDMGMSESDLRCGSQEPADIPARDAMIRAGETPCQIHNNCSGKHTGFLTLNRHIGGGTEYVEADHPVQKAVRAAFEETTGMDSPGYAIDGCSAPNFATSVTGLARAMAFFANAHKGSSVRDKAAARLTAAMATFPEMVAGETRACTELMRAMDHKVAIKTGAEAVFVAIIPELGLGVALKVIDGGTRGAECAIAAILCELGVLDPEHPATRQRMNVPLLNRRGLDTGIIRPAPGFPT
ncbi:asparaginase [Pseudooceanicola sp. HF7]|uniref:asparaginase n=1 Tax=Pseudooceanicola sp. HF7 TaxID=2721560 RepID=UPI0014303C09|nr:asparaginase [Pseudooceanicola sp. HF7]NIZ09055.1 asparaginase [Pseudooceanicola sp. HF7]